MTSLDCRNDLVLRERRGRLSSAEELALRTHLDSCESCRVSREIGAAFDAQGEPELDDGARIARLATHARAQAQTPERRPPGRALRVLLLAASLTLLTGVAAAAAAGWLPMPGNSPGHVSTTSHVVHATASKKPALTTRSADATPTALPTSNALPSPPASSSDPARAPAQTSPPSAAQLFRKANEARRAGQAQQAIQLYRSLQRDYPGSAEAALSPVSLGGLLLNRASAGAALEQFDHYLAASPRAPLAAEALYGRARALQALGRHSEERRTWEQLLSRFPGCPYRESARRRLGELR